MIRIITLLAESSLTLCSTITVPKTSRPFAIPDIVQFRTGFMGPTKTSLDGDIVHDAPLSNIRAISSGVIPMPCTVAFRADRYTINLTVSFTVLLNLGIYCLGGWRGISFLFRLSVICLFHSFLSSLMMGQGFVYLRLPSRDSSSAAFKSSDAEYATLFDIFIVGNHVRGSYMHAPSDFGYP